MKRLAALLAAAVAAALGTTAALAGGPNGTKTTVATADLPTLTLTMTGSSIAAGGDEVSGGIRITSTVSGEQAGAPTLVRLNPGVTFEQAFGAVQAQNGSPDAIAPYGSIVFSLEAGSGTSSALTTLAPGHYVALDTEKDNPANWPRTEFDVAASPQPAALPAPAETVSAIEFGFKGATVLHVGDLVRFQNSGYLAHMVIGMQAKSMKAAHQVMSLLRAGKDKKINSKLVVGGGAFLDVVSTGGMDEITINQKPGIYVLACFMDTQDGREHTQLGMERIIRIVK